MDLGLDGRRAVVTGAATGIGRAVVELLCRVALGKPRTAEEVADAVVFLASARASQVTGTVLAVHGGMATHLM